jgi:hypothetical protein
VAVEHGFDTRALVVFFEPELTLALLPVWWMEIPSIAALDRTYHGLPVDDLIFFNWMRSTSSEVMGLEVFIFQNLTLEQFEELTTRVGSWCEPHGDSLRALCAWFSERRETDPDASILQDFATALYHTDLGHWCLVLDIDWLPRDQRDRLASIPARWVHAEIEWVEPGAGQMLCRTFPGDPKSFYQLRGWFAANELPEETASALATVRKRISNSRLYAQRVASRLGGTLRKLRSLFRGR